MSQHESQKPTVCGISLMPETASPLSAQPCLYVDSKYAWALTCDYPADDVGTEGYAGNATSANNTRQVVVKVCPRTCRGVRAVEQHPISIHRVSSDWSEDCGTWNETAVSLS